MQARFKNCWLAAKGALTVPAWLPWLLPLKADNMQVVSQSLRKNEMIPWFALQPYMHVCRPTLSVIVDPYSLILKKTISRIL